MKVTMYTTWKTKCGIADYSSALVRSLETNGITVKIIPVRENKKKVYFFADGNNMNHADIAHVQHEYSFFSDSRIRFLYPMLSMWHFYLFSRQITIPKFITLHELGSWEGRNPFMRILGSIFLKIYAMILGSFEGIIVHTNRFRNILIRSGLDDKRVVYIPHPIPVSKLPVATPREDTRSFKRSLTTENTKLLTIFGFVNARKGYELALSAMTELNDCFLLIAGGPQPGDRSGYFDNLLRQITALNLQGKVKVLGFLSEPELEKVMLATDIFLAPFVDASASGSLSRVMAYHKPIIASDIPSMKELKDMGLGVELFRAGDSGALKKALQYILDNNDRRMQLANLTSSFIDKYSYDRFARDLKSLYERKIQK